MTQKERDRVVWLRQAGKKQITQREAARRMGVSERWIRELLARLQVAGDRVVVHGLRGQPSNRKIKAKTEQKAMGLVKREHSDFGPTPAAEYLTPDFHFERDGPNLLMLCDAFIHAGSDARNTPRRHTPSG